MKRRDLLWLWGGPWLGQPAEALTGARPAEPGAQRHLFGSPVDLVLPDSGDRGAGRAREAVDIVWSDLADLHRRWNAWKPGEVSRLNEALRLGRRASASADLLAMIRSSAALEQASGGLFNPAIGGLVGLWGFHADILRDGPAPPRQRLEAWRHARPSLAQLRIEGGGIASDNPQVQLDFGAYAKGVAIDRAFATLRRLGVRDALLNLGGNLATMGRHDGRPWHIGIRDPMGPDLVATLSTTSEAVVTSGTYERRRRAGSEVVTHVLDPRTGASAQTLASVTVVAASAAHADAVATAALIAGPRWAEVALRMGADQVMAVDLDGRARATPALQRRLRIVQRRT